MKSINLFAIIMPVVLLLMAGSIFSTNIIFSKSINKPIDSLKDSGYALLPLPQKIEIQEGSFKFGKDWKVKLLSGVTDDHIAAETLFKRVKEELGISLSILKSSSFPEGKVIQLEIRPGSAAQGKKESLARQGYILELKSDKISICGNDNPGLFYGVQTLLQLLSAKQNLTLPVCKIEDAPDLELRIMHWCEKHHQNRMKTLKRYIDQAAEYKINGIGWQLEDKFAYERHPVIGIPGAFTKEQVREIARYALERYSELIPRVDCPAHMAFVLKHPEFAHLREDVENNYMICPTREESWDLLYDMFDELMEAFSGKYFHVSTDECYFLGTGVECGCAEIAKKSSRSRIFVDFMNKAAQYLEDKGKEVMFWGESPLSVSDITKLPSTVIDAVAGDESLERKGELEAEKNHGMRVLIYNPIHSGGIFADYIQRVHNAYKSISFSSPRKINDVLGTFIAGWDDAGPHDEAFWLGWTAGGAYAWNGGNPEPGQMIDAFMNLFYGNDAVNMLEVYQLMADGVKYWKESWNRIQEKRVTWELSMQGYPTTLQPIYGYWAKPYKFPVPRPRRVASLELPNLPDTYTLFNQPYWRDRYRVNLENIDKEKKDNIRLIKLLNENLNKVSKNKYNMEVLLSLANLFNHNINFLETMGMIEDTLSSAAKNFLDYEHAVSCLETAEKLAEDICKEREQTYQELKMIWEVSRHPKGQTVNGRKFVHILDDTKNHTADLTPDLSYIIMRERNLNLEKWIYDLKGIRHNFTLKYKKD